MTVRADDAVSGAWSRLTFRLHNDSDTAGTVGLTVNFPTDTPFAVVSVKPHVGWDVEVARDSLDHRWAGSSTLDEVVTAITWTAQGDTMIAPGQFDEFEVSVGPLPEEERTVEFPADQHQSDGAVVSWSEPPDDHSEGSRPSPAFTGGGGDGSGGSDSGHDDEGGRDDPADPAEPAPTSSDQVEPQAAATSGERDTAARVLAGVALVVGGPGSVWPPPLSVGGAPVRERRTRRLAAAVAATALAGVALLLGAAPAAAHNTLTGSTPADDSTVTDPVTEVVLEFDQAVQAEFAQVAVLGADQTPYGSGEPAVVGRTVTQTVEPLPAGRYDISYRVVSADGHPVSGTISFTATGQAAPPPVETPTAEPTRTPAVAEPTPADADTAPATAEADPTGAAVAVSESTGLPTAALVGGALAAAAGVAAVAFLVVRRRPGGDVGAGPADTGS